MITNSLARSGPRHVSFHRPESGLRRRRVGRCIVVFALACLLGNTASGQYTTVPLDHQVYPLLKKAEDLQLFSSYALRVLPLERATVLSLLQEISRREDELSKADRRLLQQMLGEFRDPAISAEMHRDGEIHAFRYEEGDAQIFIDLRGAQVFRFSHRV